MGQWTSEALAVVQGGGRHFAAGELGDTPFVKNRYTYVIERQEGNAFAGYFLGEVTGFREPFTKRVSFPSLTRSPRATTLTVWTRCPAGKVKLPLLAT